MTVLYPLTNVKFPTTKEQRNRQKRRKFLNKYKRDTWYFYYEMEEHWACNCELDGVESKTMRFARIIKLYRKP